MNILKEVLSVIVDSFGKGLMEQSAEINDCEFTSEKIPEANDAHQVTVTGDAENVDNTLYDVSKFLNNR
jgi:hypothetical protein